MEKLLSYRDSGIIKNLKDYIPDDVYASILQHVPVLCVDLIIVREHSVFLIKRKQKPSEGVYWVQGGRLNKNELPEQVESAKPLQS